MEETNAAVTKRVPRFYTDEFKKETALDYEARRNEYPSVKAFADEKSAGKTSVHRLKINGVTVEGDCTSLAALIGAMSHADD